jgi:hypothetical protein
MTEKFEEAVRSLPILVLTPQEQAVHLRMLAALPVGRTRRRRRRRAAIIAGAVGGIGVIGVGTAGALGVFSAPPADRSEGYCYATTDLHDRSASFGFAIARPPGQKATTQDDAASQAMDICTDAWRQGRLSSAAPKVRPPQPPPWTHPVPPLIACVLTSGQVAVLPGDANTCALLDLPVAELTK